MTSPQPPTPAINAPSSEPNVSMDRPNWALLILGLVFALILVFSYFVQKTIYPAPIQALLIASAMVLLLFGMYPVPAMKGKFGRLSVAGPMPLT